MADSRTVRKEKQSFWMYFVFLNVLCTKIVHDSFEDSCIIFKWQNSLSTWHDISTFHFIYDKATLTIYEPKIFERNISGVNKSPCTELVSLLNLHWHELWKQQKSSSLGPPRGIFYKSQWAWQDVKLTRLTSIFTSKKVWKFLIKIQQTKSDPK